MMIYNKNKTQTHFLGSHISNKILGNLMSGNDISSSVDIGSTARCLLIKKKDI